MSREGLECWESRLREGICYHGQQGTEPWGLLQELGSNGELWEGEGSSGTFWGVSRQRLKFTGVCITFYF